MSQRPIAEQTILAVFPAGEDRTALDSMLRPPDWQLQFTQAFDEARVVLRTAPVGMLICDERFPGDYNWKDLLHELHQMISGDPNISAHSVYSCCNRDVAGSACASRTRLPVWNS
jgi:hypothetical protein